MDSPDLEKIMQTLDKWVLLRGNGNYVPEDFESPAFTNYGIPEDLGIQQIRSEIKEFASVISQDKYKQGTALEIGLGYFGSTHFLWRQLFDKVTSIEKSHDRVRHFGENLRDFYGKWVADDGKSSFLIGLSNDTEIVNKAYTLLKDGVDMLFVDGDHRYPGALTDWLLYSPLVKKGGIIAFHDAKGGGDICGVPRLLENLEQGKIDGKKYDFSKIIHSKEGGIAFYEKSS